MGKRMTGPGKRLLAVFLLIVVVTTGGSLASLRARTVTAQTGGPAVPGAASSAGSIAAGSGAVAVSSGSGAEALAAFAQAVAAAPGAQEPQIPPEGLEFCGVRRVPADELRRWVADRAHGRAQWKQLEEQMLSAGKVGLTRLSARLAVGNDRQQVAARLLMRDVDGAAALAERSTDVQAYQMALSACGRPGVGAPHCARLNPRRWAELDPSDARPWLRLVRIAQRNKDAAGVDAALAEAATRPRLSRGSYLLEAHAVAVADAVPDAGELGHALVLAIGFDAAMDSDWDVPAASRVCRGEGLRDATRLGHCRTLARQILANTSDISEAIAAQAMADRVGVPREQQAHEATTLKAATERFQTMALPDLNPTCGSMQDIRQFSSARSAHGDLGMALAALPARPTSR